MMKRIGTLMVAVSALAISSNANAFEYTPYVGLDYVHSIANTKGAEHFKPDYDGLSVNVGVNYNKFFGTELFYQRTDKDNKHDMDGDKLKTHYQAYGLDLMGYLPLYGCDGQLSLVGTAGFGFYDVKGKATWLNHQQTDSGYGYRFGAGLQYDINSNVAVRALVRHVELDKIDGYDHMMEYSAGVRYTF